MDENVREKVRECIIKNYSVCINNEKRTIGLEEKVRLVDISPSEELCKLFEDDYYDVLNAQLVQFSNCNGSYLDYFDDEDYAVLSKLCRGGSNKCLLTIFDLWLYYTDEKILHPESAMKKALINITLTTESEVVSGIKKEALIYLNKILKLKFCKKEFYEYDFTKIPELYENVLEELGIN